MRARLLSLCLFAACGGTPANSTTPTGGGEPAPTPTATDVTPIVAEHGGTAWAVYTYVGADEAARAEAVAALAARGLEVGTQIGDLDLNCDEGAVAAAGGDDSLYGVGVYFSSEADARAWVAAQGLTPALVAEVQTMCRD